jgi:antitoxin (DNA-binding transcriptional repressor) of toxin-antitoxin stability system
VETTITATELARNLSQVLNRVRYKGETFRVLRGTDVVAEIGPPPADLRFTAKDFVDLLRRLPRPDDKFADDLEWIRNNQPPLGSPPEWPS